MEKDICVNPTFVESVGEVKNDKKIKDCNSNNLFDFLVSSHFAMFFLDLEELRKFVLFLYNKKNELVIDELIKNFKEFVKEFKEELKKR